MRKESGQLTPEEEKNKELQDALRHIIQTISGNYRLNVTTKVDPLAAMDFLKQGKNPDKMWFRREIRDRRTGQKYEYVHIPSQIMEATETVAQGKAAHEAGHSAISRSHFIPDEVLQEIGFHAVLGAAEERPTDQVVRERFAGAGDWVDEARKKNVLKQAEIPQKAREGLGYIPKFSSLSDLLVYGPHYKEIPDLYPSDVIEVYDKVKKAMEKLERTIPPIGASEEVIEKFAVERYKIFYRQIWPHVKPLIEQDLQQESIRQMLEEAMKERGEGEKTALDQLPDDLKKELEEIAQEMMKSMAQAAGEPSEEEGRGQPEQGQKISMPLKGAVSEKMPAEKGEGRKEGQQQGQGRVEEEGRAETEGRGETEAAKGEVEEGREEETEGEGEEGGGEQKGEIPIPMDKLSQALMEALQKAFDNLTPEQKQALQQKAQEALERIEDEIVKDLEGNLLDEPAETHKEYEERKEGERQKQGKPEGVPEETREGRAQRVKEEMERIKERQMERQAGGYYELYYRQVKDYDDELYRRLEEIFTPNIKRTMRLKSAGARLNLPAVFRWEGQRATGVPTINNRIFESLHLPEKKDYAISLVVDLSSSMGGEKIEETFKGVVLLTEVLNRLGVAFEIIGFNDDYFVIKDFDSDLNNEVREKIAKALSNPQNNTETGPALSVASRRLEERYAKEKFILVLTDGNPESARGGRNAPAQLRDAVSYLLEKTNQKLIGLGLGPGTDMVKEYFPIAAPNLEVQKITEVLGELLEDIITNPQKYNIS